MKKIALLALAPLILASCTLFGQPKQHAVSVTDGKLTTITVAADSVPLASIAVSLQGTNLDLVKRPINSQCYISTLHTIIYCKFDDLTPYSNASMIYSGEATKKELGYFDTGINKAVTEQIK